MQVSQSGWLLDSTGNWDNVRGTNWNDAVLDARLFVRAPRFVGNAVSSNDSQIGTMTTVADLRSAPGWQEGATPIAAGAAASTTTGGRVNVTVADFEFVCEPVYLSAVAISLREGASSADTDPLLFVFRPDEVVLFGGDSGYPGIVKYSTSTETPYLFSYLTGTGPPQAAPGPLEISVPLVDWESAHAAHVWLSPQRTNLVANPSFETLGEDDQLFGWRSSATLGRVSGGVGPAPREWCAHLSGSGSTKVLESNFFPAANERGLWSVEAAVSGTGTVRLGIVFWERGMAPADCEYTCQQFTLSGGSATGGFQVLRTLVAAPDDAWEAQFRLEFDGTQGWVDNVLVEPNEAQGGYFDGEWSLGQPDDFKWYGGTGSEHRSFSTYYPDRRRIGRYLFGYATTVDGVQTLHPGAVEDHVPGGTRVVPHWDDVYYNRSHSWSLDVKVPVDDFQPGGKTVAVTLGSGKKSVTTVAPDGSVTTVTV